MTSICFQRLNSQPGCVAGWATPHSGIFVISSIKVTFFLFNLYTSLNAHFGLNNVTYADLDGYNAFVNLQHLNFFLI